MENAKIIILDPIVSIITNKYMYYHQLITMRENNDMISISLYGISKYNANLKKSKTVKAINLHFHIYNCVSIVSINLKICIIVHVSATKKKWKIRSTINSMTYNPECRNLNTYRTLYLNPIHYLYKVLYAIYSSQKQYQKNL